MNILQYHIGGGIAEQKEFRKIGEIFDCSNDCFQIQLIGNNGLTFYYYIWPFRKWQDNTSDFLTLDGKTYSEKELYTFCANRITEDILNTLEADND